MSGELQTAHRLLSGVSLLEEFEREIAPLFTREEYETISINQEIPGFPGILSQNLSIASNNVVRAKEKLDNYRLASAEYDEKSSVIRFTPEGYLEVSRDGRDKLLNLNNMATNILKDANAVLKNTIPLVDFLAREIKGGLGQWT